MENHISREAAVELLQKTLDAMKDCETKVLKESALWQDMKNKSRAARRGNWKTEPMPEPRSGAVQVHCQPQDDEN